MSLKLNECDSAWWYINFRFCVVQKHISHLVMFITTQQYLLNKQWKPRHIPHDFDRKSMKKAHWLFMRSKCFKYIDPCVMERSIFRSESLVSGKLEYSTIIIMALSMLLEFNKTLYDFKHDWEKHHQSYLLRTTLWNIYVLLFGLRKSSSQKSSDISP